MADDDCIGSFSCLIFGIGRADDDVVAPIFQRMIITKDDIGLVIRYTVTGYVIMSTDDIIVFAVG